MRSSRSPDRIVRAALRHRRWFGRQVPALVVKQAADSVGDTYPHRESGNLVVTIHQFLTGALAALAPTRGHRPISGGAR